MPRTVLLFSNGWVDTPLEELASRAADWGYAGFELATWGDHLEIRRAVTEPDYCSDRLELLSRFELQLPVVAAHRISTAVCDQIDGRHRPILPDYIYGDGQTEGVRQRATEEMMSIFRIAQRLGATLVSGFTGSTLWGSVNGWPHLPQEMFQASMREFAQRWNPILDVAQETGVKFAYEVHPGQIAFDFYSAERVLDALNGREEFGFTFDPSHFHWQGLDSVEFIRHFGDRIYHVHIKDCVLNLNGRNSILGSYLPMGDPRRGYEFRAPGRGGIDWEGIIRELNQIGYSGSLSVEFSDRGMNRDFGAEEACKFVKRLDFEPASPPQDRAFR
jgi:sugar phosphate isomerase/epimerase